MEHLASDPGRTYREGNPALTEVAGAHHAALVRLAPAAEFHDDNAGAHFERIGFPPGALARLTGEPAPGAAMLRLAAPMHDVGRIGTPDAVLEKPGTPTPEEREVMKGHARIGADILGLTRIPLPQFGAQVAHTHHARRDGGGDPRRQAGEAIPLARRIVSVVEVFDARTTDRCCRKALSDPQAHRMLQAGRGSAFDPRLVHLFCAHAVELVALRERVSGAGFGFGFGDLIAGPQSLGSAAPLDHADRRAVQRG